MNRRQVFSILAAAPIAALAGVIAVKASPTNGVHELSAKDANFGEMVVGEALYDPRHTESDFWRAAYEQNGLVWGAAAFAGPHGEIPQRVRDFVGPDDNCFYRAIDGRLHVHNRTRNTFASLPYSGLVTA